jgi:sugar phosphate isomerase/epimerase
MQKHSFSRREILSGAAAAGLVVAAGSVAAAASETSASRVPGIQLYTVRDAMATDVAATLQAIAGIGYQEVEFAGYFERSPNDIRELLKRFGLAAPSAHMDARTLRENPQPSVETAAAIGHDYVTLAWLHPDDRKTIDDYKRWAEVLNRVGEVCRSNGMRAAYHNHDFEFMPLQGQMPFDVLLRETDTDLVYFELDFYWVRKAGMDILEVIGKAPDRFTMSHIKDMDAAGDMVEVGSGTIDFAAILADPRAVAIRHCFVEHDAPSDPFQSVAFSHYALQAILD